MAVISERTLKVLQSLSQMTEPTRATEIGIAIGEKPIDVGRMLAELLKAGFSEKTDEEQNLWAVTDKGAEYLDKIGAKPLSQPIVTSPVVGITPETPETVSTVPSQADLFRKEGELLGIGVKKGGISLDVIVKWVERTANLDDLNSVWNALTEMGVANDVKKRWIKLYAQNLPGKEIPSELKEKLEAGQEGDKVGAEGKLSEISPKPKRFSVVGDQIIGDAEGDLSFKEALQLLAQQKGVPAAQASPLADMVEAMKLGPAMATETLTTMIPLITNQQKPDSTMASILQEQNKLLSQQIQTLQAQIVTVSEERHKAEMESLRVEIRTGQKPPEADKNIEHLTQQMESLREELHKQQLALVQEQNKAAQEQLKNQIDRLDLQITALSQGKHEEGRYGLMRDTLTAVKDELKGVRADVKPLIQDLLARGIPAPRPRTPEEKAKFSAGLDRGIKRSQEAARLENKLFFAGGESAS